MANEIDTAAKKKKLQALRTAMKQLEKATKSEGIVQILGDGANKTIQSTPSGFLPLDIALGIGGFPVGRVIELFGAESSGKSLVSTVAMAECQKRGGVCALIDAENSFDPGFARKLGLIPEELVISTASEMETALLVVDSLVDSGGVDMIVVDSVAALVPKVELDGEIGKANMAPQARILSPFLRRIVGKCAQNNVTLIFINQIRDNLGVMYGDTTTTPGGKALKFYSSVRIQVSKVGSSQVIEKKGGEDIIVGHTIRCNVKKNKVAPPFRKAEFQIFFDGRPRDKVAELAQIALNKGLIPRYDAAGNLSATGRTFKWASEPEFVAKSKDEVTEQLRKFEKVQEELTEMLKNGVEVEEPTSEDLEELSESEFLDEIDTADDKKSGSEAEETTWEEI